MKQELSQEPKIGASRRIKGWISQPQNHDDIVHFYMQNTLDAFCSINSWHLKGKSIKMLKIHVACFDGDGVMTQMWHKGKEEDK